MTDFYSNTIILFLGKTLRISRHAGPGTILFFLSGLLFFSPFSRAGDLPVTVGAGTYPFCFQTHNAVPVTVANMLGVDSLNLVLQFDTTLVSYESFHGINSQVNNGDLSVNENNGVISINWHGQPATLLNDTLVKLVFYAKSAGTGTLAWDTQVPGNCYFRSSGGNVLPGEYNNAVLFMNSPLKLTLTEIDATCYGKCNANYMATMTGGTAPFTYLWNDKPGRFDSIQTDMCDGPNEILVRDALGCELDSLFTITGMPGPRIRLIVEPDTLYKFVYLQNPVIRFSFEETGESHITSPPLWEFGDGDTAISFNPVHEYITANNLGEQGEYELKLHVVNSNGCDTIIEQKLAIQKAFIKIGNVITPDGNEENNVFKIVNDKYNPDEENLYPMDEEFQQIQVYIFDRWGRRIFSDSNYQNDWVPRNVPDGAYFYYVKLTGKYNTYIRKGTLTILNSGAR